MNQYAYACVCVCVYKWFSVIGYKKRRNLNLIEKKKEEKRVKTLILSYVEPYYLRVTVSVSCSEIGFCVANSHSMRPNIVGDI